MASENAPRGSSLPLWLFSLCAAGAAAVLGLTRLPDSPQSVKSPADLLKSEKKLEPSEQPDEAGPLTVLRDYLRVTAETSKKSSSFHLQLTHQSGGLSRSLTLDQKRFNRGNEKPLLDYLLLDPAVYEFLIATVPDPVDSKLPNEFDATLDSIQRAFEARKYLLRASRMPWPRSQGQENKNVASRPDHFYRQYPGVLLFRKSREELAPDMPLDSASYAVVCLVGESPISGIHKLALTRSFEAWEELHQAIDRATKSDGRIQWSETRHVPSSSIQIIAPYFSGSQESLIATLREWKKRHKDALFRIVNGSALALNPRLFSAENLEVPVSTVISSEAMISSTLRYLAGFRGTNLKEPESDKQTRGRVAILREANTGFGARTIHTGMLDLPFPMSISRLEIAWEQYNKPKVALPQTEFVEPKSSVSDQTQLDSIPPYDPESAASTAGQSLRAITTTITRARIPYVGIVATDMRDVVFLNQLLRKECPDVQVFTIAPTIALIHPDEAYHLRGMVVASTYPLAPSTQYWAQMPSTPNQMISFPTHSSQGYYNAVLAQYDQSNLMIGYRPPWLRDVEGPFNQPPIWISIVGQGGRFIPVHCFTEYDDVFSPSSPPAAAADISGNQLQSASTGSVPLLFRTPALSAAAASTNRAQRLPVIGIPTGVLLGSLGAISALITAVILALTVPWVWQRKTTDLENKITGSQDGAKEIEPISVLWMWIWRGAMLGGILLFVLPYTFPAQELWDPCCSAPHGNLEWRYWFVCRAAIVLHAATVLIAVWLFRLAFSQRRSANPRESWVGYFILALFVFFAWFFTTWWGWRLSATERFFLYVRASDLTAGLSPLIPMGLLGLAAFAAGWFGLRQIDLSWRTSCTSLLAAVGNKENPRGHRRFGDVKVPAAFIMILCPFLLCLAWNAFVIPLFFSEMQYSTSRWGDWIMRLVFWLAVVTVLLAFIRFLLFWSRLAQLMHEILSIPMVAAFERLPHEISRLFKGSLYSGWACGRQLVATAWVLPPHSRQELATRIASDRPKLAWLFGDLDSRKGDYFSPDDAKWLAKLFQEKARDFLRQLSAEWKNRSIEEAFGTGQPQKLPSTGTAPTASGTDKEDYVAAFFVFYLSGCFAQLRLLVFPMAIGAPLLLFAGASYPFQPDWPRLPAPTGLSIAVAVTISTIYVLFQINTNGLVSRIVRTTPHRFNPNVEFFTSLITYVLPILTLVLLHVLGLLRFIVEPVLGLIQ